MQVAQTRERRDAATFRKDRGRRPSVLCHSRLRWTGVFAQWRESRLTPPEAHTTEDRASVAWLTRLSGVWRHTITSEQRFPELLLIPERQPNFRCNCSARRPQRRLIANTGPCESPNNSGCVSVAPRWWGT